MTSQTLCEATRSHPGPVWAALKMVVRRGASFPLRAWRRLTPGAVHAEARAVLDGRAADAYAKNGEPVPYWAWLNALAHRPPSDIQALAIEFQGEEWFGATVEIAAELSRVGPGEAPPVQSVVFLPAELEALACREPSPDAIVRAVRREIATSHRRSHDCP